MAPRRACTGRGDPGLVLGLKWAPRPPSPAGPARQAQPVRLQGPGGACSPPQGPGKSHSKVKTWVASDGDTLGRGSHHQTSSAALTQGPVDAGHGATVLGTRGPWGEGAGASPLSPWNTGGLISGPLRASSFHPTLSGPCPQIAHCPVGQMNQGQRPPGSVKGRDLQADLCGVRGGQGAFTAALTGKPP